MWWLIQLEMVGLIKRICGGAFNWRWCGAHYKDMWWLIQLEMVWLNKRICGGSFNWRWCGSLKGYVVAHSIVDGVAH